jgi:hypothetical protein
LGFCVEESDEVSSSGPTSSTSWSRENILENTFYKNTFYSENILQRWSISSDTPCSHGAFRVSRLGLVPCRREALRVSRLGLVFVTLHVVIMRCVFQGRGLGYLFGGLDWAHNTGLLC